MHTETDGGDVTYFLIHHLDVVRRALDELHAYLAERVDAVRGIESVLRADSQLNHRQVALLSHALRHEDTAYTFAEHASIHHVTHETARNDLRLLVDRGLLTERREGRRIRFRTVPDIRDRLGSA